MDRDFYDYSFAVGMVLHDMPQHENRVELDDKVKDAWGLPVARITNKIHENDLKMGRWSSTTTPRFWKQPEQRRSTVFIPNALPATVRTSTAPRGWAMTLKLRC
jgi:hypothetical protein